MCSALCPECPEHSALGSVTERKRDGKPPFRGDMTGSVMAPEHLVMEGTWERQKEGPTPHTHQQHLIQVQPKKLS